MGFPGNHQRFARRVNLGSTSASESYELTAFVGQQASDSSVAGHRDPLRRRRTSVPGIAFSEALVAQGDFADLVDYQSSGNVGSEVVRSLSGREDRCHFELGLEDLFGGADLRSSDYEVLNL